MADIEKVIKGLELCTNISQDGCLMLCPYKDEKDETYSGFCEQVLKQDALALLKSQQAEIERLREIATRDCDICANKMLNDERRWIPVSERLPEMRINPLTNDYDTIICLCKFGNDTDVRMYKFGGVHFYHGVMCMDEYVTHWMYKPQPPKEAGMNSGTDVQRARKR